MNKMKKILLVLLTLVVIFTFAGCDYTALVNEYFSSKLPVITENSSVDKHNAGTVSELPIVAENSSVDEHDTNKTNSKQEATLEKEMTTMNVKVASTTFTATLEDNKTAKALVAQLPLMLAMSELNGNEKYNYLSSNLNADPSSCPGTINTGDLMLYGNNCLVLFYKTFDTSYNYVKLGHIDDTVGLAKALGSGSVQVTFSVSK